MTRNPLLVLPLLFFVSCAEPDEPVRVDYRGSLRGIMHEGKTGAAAALREIRDIPNLYALGAVGNLKGEFIILDGVPFISTVRDSTLAIDTTFDNMAALLVYCSVAEWTSFPLPDSITSMRELEEFVGSAGGRSRPNPDEPFPFILEGAVRAADWHVIDWPTDDTVHTHEKHKASGLRGTIEHSRMTILGFYSTRHHAVFTHHSTNMHLHGVTEERTIAGHLDNVVPGDGMILKLPSGR